MTRGLLLSIAVAALSATPVHAQTIGVRTGEHEGFTRVALDLPEPIDWTLQTVPGAAVLSFAKADVEFELAGAFRRISRARLASLTPDADPGTLRLGLACACRISTHLNGPRMLVIDIADPPSSAATEKAVRPSGRPWALPLFPERSEVRTASFRTAVLAPLPERLSPSQLFDEPVGPRIATDGEVGERTGGSVAQETSLREAEARLAEQFARAVSQGLLATRRGPIPSEPGSGGETRADDADLAGPKDASGGRPEQETETMTRDAPLRAITALDAVQIRPGMRQQPEAGTCLPAPTLDVASWGNDEPFPHQLARARDRIASYERTPSTESVIALARLYLHFGFGAEARATLRLAQIEDETRAPLLALAAVMDGDAAPMDPLPAQAQCPDPGPLWALLATSPEPRVSPEMAEAVRRSFVALPQHLRRHLGPRLVDKLREGGRPDAAHALLRALDRLDGFFDGAGALAAAQLSAERGDIRDAEARLAAIIARDGSDAPEALATLVRGRAERGEPIAPEMAKRAAIYAHEARGTAAEKDIARAHVMALAASGAHRAAIDELVETGWPGRDPAAATVLGRLASDAPDAVFVSGTLRLAAATAADLPPAIGTAVGRRLLDLGFLETAEPYLSAGMNDAPVTARSERAIERARLALATGRPRRAEAELLGVDGAAADALRAEARLKTGDRDAAVEAFLASDRPADAQRAAWLAGDWDRLADGNDPILARAAQILAEVQATPAELEGPEPSSDDPEAPGDEAAGEITLSASRATLGRSEEARAILEDLLARFPAEEPPR
ncbi:hypothetical protein [Rhodosalinus sp. 5P4]|uniref:hypothetical protein n=1 Tax=Rhodosalinus sp. 5P4 TaxID=3239196 RepID=UPI003526992E